MDLDKFETVYSRNYKNSSTEKIVKNCLHQKRLRQPHIFFVGKIKDTQLAKTYIIFTDFVGTDFSVKNFEF